MSQRPSYRCLFVSYLYDLSEYQMEELVNYNLVVKWFVGLAVDEPAPDQRPIIVFQPKE